MYIWFSIMLWNFPSHLKTLISIGFRAAFVYNPERAVLSHVAFVIRAQRSCNHGRHPESLCVTSLIVGLRGVQRG